MVSFLMLYKAKNSDGVSEGCRDLIFSLGGFELRVLETFTFIEGQTQTSKWKLLSGLVMYNILGIKLTE